MITLLITVLQLHCAQVGTTDGYLRYGVFSYQNSEQSALAMGSFQEQSVGDISPHPLCLKIQTGLNEGHSQFKCSFRDSVVVECSESL